MKGDYYFTTGTVRIGSPDNQFDDSTKADVIASLRNAVTNSGATIGSHNGGLSNPTGSPTEPTAYDYWHWGPDPALDTSPPGYASGYAYAQESLETSFEDIETWIGASPCPGATGLSPVDNGRAGCGAAGDCPRTFVSPYFNEGREGSHQILNDLGVE